MSERSERTDVATRDSYPDLLRQLARVTRRLDTQRAEADAWYDSQCAAADRAVRDAAQAVRRAEAEVAAAQETAERVEAEVGHLWQVLRSQMGWSRRLGDAPVPTAGAAAEPTVLLEGVRDLLERTRRRGELPSSTQPLLALFGVLGSVLAYALGVAARMAGERHGGDLAVGMPVLGLVVALLGPIVGLAPARLLADRRHAAVDLRVVAVVVVTGAVTTGVLFARFGVPL